MSIRKREWRTRKGKKQTRWIVDYGVIDPDTGKRIRSLKTFYNKKAAEDFEAETTTKINSGELVPESKTVTVGEASDRWIKEGEAANLEKSTIDVYRQHVRLHIKPLIGNEKLTAIKPPRIGRFQQELRDKGRTPALTRNVSRSLSAIFSYAQAHGLVGSNPLASLRHRRRGASAAARHKPKLRVGVDIPTTAEVRKLLALAEGMWAVFMNVLVSTGLRSSEMRGLRWEDVDLQKGELHVTQRADRYQKIGKPKSAAGSRSIPLLPTTVSLLRNWKLKCPKYDGKLGLVFPTGSGRIMTHVAILKQGLNPLSRKADVTVPVLNEQGTPTCDENGQPIVKPKYSGLHAFRHYYASFCINRREDGGLALPLKVVQTRMGHSTSAMTADVYGHLFPNGDSASEIEAADKALFG